MPANVPRRSAADLERAKEIGARIRARRRGLKLNVTKVASSAGVSADHLYNLERGVHIAYGRTLTRIAKALRTSVSELTGEPVTRVA